MSWIRFPGILPLLSFWIGHNIAPCLYAKLASAFARSCPNVAPLQGWRHKFWERFSVGSTLGFNVDKSVDS